MTDVKGQLKTLWWITLLLTYLTKFLEKFPTSGSEENVDSSWGIDRFQWKAVSFARHWPRNKFRNFSSHSMFSKIVKLTLCGIFFDLFTTSWSTRRCPWLLLNFSKVVMPWHIKLWKLKYPPLPVITCKFFKSCLFLAQGQLLILNNMMFGWVTW